MDVSSNSSLPESQIGLAMQYEIAFEAWKFQVNSYWQRNSYFAAFQSVALAGAWKILGHWSAIALCTFGILLVLIWYINNQKVYAYVRYWWESIKALEETDSTKFALVKSYEDRCEKSRIGRFRFVRYSTVINAIPLLFLYGWLWMLTMSIIVVASGGGKTSALVPPVGGTSTKPTVSHAVTPSQETPLTPPLSSSPSVSKSAGTPTPHSESPSKGSEGREQVGEFKGYNRLSVPNTFYRDGLAFGVDSEGNRYALSDLIKEAGLKTYSAKPPYSSFRVSIPDSEVEKAIDENRWGDLVSRVLFVVKTDAQKRGVEAGDVELKVVKIESKKTDLTNAWQAVRGTQFWRQRSEKLVGVRLFLVAETISSHTVILNFPKTNREVLNQAFGELREMGSDTFVKLGPTSMETRSRLPLILACKSVALDANSSSKNEPAARLLAARMERQAGRPGLPTPTVEKESSDPALATVPLRSTHYTDTPPLVSFARSATYGDILTDLKQKVFAAGIDEVRIYDSGFGFALATRFEVTEQNGMPLASPARFLPLQAQGRKLRGYYITVAAHPTPSTHVSTRRSQDLFSLDYGMNSLPDDMDRIPIEPGTTVRVYVLEFEKNKSGARQVQNQECASSAQTHMAQSGLVK